MIKITYDENHYQATPDGRVESLVAETIDSLKLAIELRDGANSTNSINFERVRATPIRIEITTSTLVLVNRFRLAVARKEVAIDQIEFWYKTVKLEHSRFGNFDPYPVDIPSIDVDILEKLILTNIAQRKDERNEQIRP